MSIACNSCQNGYYFEMNCFCNIGWIGDFCSEKCKY